MGLRRERGRAKSELTSRRDADAATQTPKDARRREGRGDLQPDLLPSFASAHSWFIRSQGSWVGPSPATPLGDNAPSRATSTPAPRIGKASTLTDIALEPVLPLLRLSSFGPGALGLGREVLGRVGALCLGRSARGRGSGSHARQLRIREVRPRGRDESEKGGRSESKVHGQGQSQRQRDISRSLQISSS